LKEIKKLKAKIDLIDIQLKQLSEQRNILCNNKYVLWKELREVEKLNEVDKEK